MRYSAWIEELIKRHIGVVLSNYENRQVIARIRNYLQKRTSQKDHLESMKVNLNGVKSAEEVKKFVPKFSYVERKAADKMEE